MVYFWKIIGKDGEMSNNIDLEDAKLSLLQTKDSLEVVNSLIKKIELLCKGLKKISVGSPKFTLILSKLLEDADYAKCLIEGIVGADPKEIGVPLIPFLTQLEGFLYHGTIKVSEEQAQVFINSFLQELHRKDLLKTEKKHLEAFNNMDQDDLVRCCDFDLNLIFNNN